MYHNKFPAVLAVMLLIAFSQGFAQDAEQVLQREFAFGTNRGGGAFSPRFLYKRTNEKRTFRASFTGTFLQEENGIQNPDSCFSDGWAKLGVRSISAGIGYEKRNVVLPKLSFFYGMEFRLVLATTFNTMNSNFTTCPTNSLRFESHQRFQTAGLSWYPFLGLRYDPLPFFSVAVEAGPSLGVEGYFETNEGYFERRTGTQAPEIRRNKNSQFVWTSFINFVNLPFVTVAYHF